MEKNNKYFYDIEIAQSTMNFYAASEMLLKHNCYIYHDLMVEEDILSNGTNWNKFAYAMKDGKIHKYYYEIDKWGDEVKELGIPYNRTKTWKAVKLNSNKHIGSDFDDFLKTNNIELKRDMNWALKMLGLGKIMTREGNRSLVLFPPHKANNQETKITVQDLFAEDWIVVQSKTFKEVIDDFYAGKTIRRISWHPSYGLGKYAKPHQLRYADILADDWEIVDVVEEVNQLQNNHLKDRNER